MTYKELQEETDKKALELMEKLKELSIYPVTQHPDYSDGPAYDIDDIVEYLESLSWL